MTSTAAFLSLLALLGADPRDARLGRDSRDERGYTPVVLQLLANGPDASQIASGILKGGNGETVTTTRASTKTCTKSDGTLVTLGANLPCVEAAGLLVESAATNLAPYSLMSCTPPALDLCGTSGVFYGALTVGADVGPDGVAGHAYRYTEDTSTNVHQINWRAVLTLTPDAVHTFSVLLKAGTRNWVKPLFQSGAQAGAWFDLTAGVFGTADSGVTAVATQLGNGWWRISVSRIGCAGCTVMTPGLYISGANGVSNYTGNGTGYVLIHGIQVETGPLATSLITTLATPTTRLADVVKMSAAKLPTASGSVRVSFTPLFTSSIWRPPDATLFDTGSGGTGGLTLDISYGSPFAFIGGAVVSATEPYWVAGHTYKVKVAWGAGAVNIYRDGTLLKTQGGLTLTVVNAANLFIGSSGTAAAQAVGWLSNLRVTK